MAEPAQIGTYAEKLRTLETRLAQVEGAGGGGDGSSGGLEPRLAKLEAQMEAVRADLSKLTAVPADVATIKERLSHLPTRLDVKNDVDSAVDRAGTRTQRTILLAGSIIGMIVAILANWTRIFE